MMDDDFLAAWVYSGAPSQDYTVDQLKDEKIVEELFDYCQILQAVISARGWQYLIQTHGLDGLLRINDRSGWFNKHDRLDAMCELEAECINSGYDPEEDRFGSYDEETKVFTRDDGTQRKINWGVAWMPALGPDGRGKV